MRFPFLGGFPLSSDFLKLISDFFKLKQNLFFGPSDIQYGYFLSQVPKKCSQCIKLHHKVLQTFSFWGPRWPPDPQSRPRASRSALVRHFSSFLELTHFHSCVLTQPTQFMSPVSMGELLGYCFLTIELPRPYPCHFAKKNFKKIYCLSHPGAPKIRQTSHKFGMA